MTMKYYRNRVNGALAGAIAMMLSASVCWGAGGQHAATVVKRGGGSARGMVRYMGASKAFKVTSVKGNVTQTVQASEVERVILVKQPAQLAQAVAAVKAGRYATAIGPLKSIKDEYEMFGPDVVAAQYLAIAYLNTGKSAEAVRMCEDVLRGNPKAADSGQFAGIYWDALLKEKKYATLRRILDDAIQTGARSVAAVALVKRGDMDMEKGEAKKALLDGYLRTVLLFQDIKAIQPEALYKAMKAHEAVNEHHFAEKWRKRLLSGYPSSEYARKLK
jgi:tetratricopeptide (TPR) repeat protein